jgi:hypothetical protein
MLGVFQFDYRPEQGQTGVQIEAEYTENGVLNLRILQPSTMIALPLYDVSKLEGRRISKPPSPVPIQPPTVTPPSGPGGGGADGSPPLDKVQQWTQNELQDAIRTANILISIANARIDQASFKDKEIREIMSELKQWIANTWEDINTRTPQIRNLNRALLNVLRVNRLIDQRELRELQKGLG